MTESFQSPAQEELEMTQRLTTNHPKHDRRQRRSGPTPPPLRLGRIDRRPANKPGSSLRQAGFASGAIDDTRFDEIVDPAKMIGHGVGGSS
jgi:hypothetical protein